MTAAPNSPLVEKVAIAICPWADGRKLDGDPAYLWSMLPEPYRQAYRDQAQAALADCEAEALKAELASLLDCQILDAHGRHMGWRLGAGSALGGGLTQRAEKARVLLARLEAKP